MSAGIRPFTPGDRPALLAVAPRLTSGIPPWCDPVAMTATARGWIEGGIAALGADSAIFVAEDLGGACIGFISVARRRHFTGEERAYIGELVVADAAEGRGIGLALLSAAERWASARGLPALALDTGAANARAHGFYAQLDFGEESVKLVKRLAGDGDGVIADDTTRRGSTAR